MTALPPDDESERLAALRGLAVLDTPAEERFDRYTRLAARLLRVPMALISLVDEHRQWFKSRFGVDLTETPREGLFCSQAIADERTLVIPDTRADPRLADHPLVAHEPGMRFYAGAPLHARNGSRVGTLCVMDYQPRQLSAEELAGLRDLADCVETELQRVDKHALEQQLARSHDELMADRERMRQLIRDWPAPMLLIEDERFIEANDAALHLLGHTDASAILGATPTDISPERQPDGETSAASAKRRFDGARLGQSTRFSWEHRDSRGQPVYVDVLLAPISREGRQLILCSWHDISEARQVEAALRRSNTELEQFAYVASHDLRQPLRMITSYVQLLERRLNPSLDDDTRKMMHFVADGAQRMDQMLVSLLEYSRVGRKGEPMARLDTRTALDEALRFLDPSVRESGASIRIEGQWPTLFASRDEITRLLQNLIGNAIKYRNPERPAEVAVSAERQREQWLFSIADNGIGIDPAQFDRLFRVFQRLHARDEYEGCGIGLAVCRKIVERHGGQIWVESAGPGQGTTFRFTLPDRPAAGAR